MSRKLFATLLLAAVATFAAPMAANAVDYTSGGDCTISPTTVQGGDSATLTCIPGTFDDSEPVTYVVSGQNGADAHLASFRTSVSTASVVKTSASDGSSVLEITVPVSASGAYAITGTGATSHASTTATITVVPADDPAGAASTTTSSGSGTGLADTGSAISTTLVSVGIGLALAGIVVVIIVAARRRHASAQR